MNFSTTTQRIAESDPIDFGQIFNSTIELFKKVWVQGFITILLTFITILPFYIIMYLPMIWLGIWDPSSFDTGELPPVVLLLMFITMPIAFLGIATVGLCLNAAFLRICWLKDMDQSAKEDYFYYLKGEYFRKAFMLALIMFGLSVLGTLLCFIGVIYLLVPLSLFPAFLAFNKDLSAMEMTKASFALGNKNWLVIFGLVLVTALVAQLGVVLCVVGVLFTAMFGKIPAYFIYKEIVGLPIDT
ncbi:hypothetical protein [Flagellimonas myxillae]|uniref:hypothetical protein n=1 Tax=Flagellimonas myxillae TaxID=2942214 RepID=UPI00201FA62F|nr:hypothetical protein [Muricauda myxillae]MCL6267716.1 hypothetical protein [Muricauda myxillae]